MSFQKWVIYCCGVASLTAISATIWAGRFGSGVGFWTLAVVLFAAALDFCTLFMRCRCSVSASASNIRRFEFQVLCSSILCVIIAGILWFVYRPRADRYPSENGATAVKTHMDRMAATAAELEDEIAHQIITGYLQTCRTEEERSLFREQLSLSKDAVALALTLLKYQEEKQIVSEPLRRDVLRVIDEKTALDVSGRYARDGDLSATQMEVERWLRVKESSERRKVDL